MTEEEQGGSAPDTEATAAVTTPAPQEPATAIAVADEPAPSADEPTTTEATAGWPSGNCSAALARRTPCRAHTASMRRTRAMISGGDRPGASELSVMRATQWPWR